MIYKDAQLKYRMLRAMDRFLSAMAPETCNASDIPALFNHWLTTVYCKLPGALEADNLLQLEGLIRSVAGGSCTAIEYTMDHRIRSEKPRMTPEQVFSLVDGLPRTDAENPVHATRRREQDGSFLRRPPAMHTQRLTLNDACIACFVRPSNSIYFILADYELSDRTNCTTIAIFDELSGRLIHRLLDYALQHTLNFSTISDAFYGLAAYIDPTRMVHIPATPIRFPIDDPQVWDVAVRAAFPHARLIEHGDRRRNVYARCADEIRRSEGPPGMSDTFKAWDGTGSIFWCMRRETRTFYVGRMGAPQDNPV